MAEHLCRLLFAEHNSSIIKPTSGSITHAVHHSVLSKTRYPCSISLRYPAKHTLAFMCCSYLGNALAQNIFAVLLISFSACYRTRLLHRHVMYKHKSSCPWLRIFFGMPYSLLPMACSFIFLSVTIMPKHEILLCPGTSLHSQVAGWGFALSRICSKHIRLRHSSHDLSAPFIFHVLPRFTVCSPFTLHPTPIVLRYVLLFQLRSQCLPYSSTITGLLLRPPRPLAYGSRYAVAIRLIFGWRFASPVRHIRSLAQCFSSAISSEFMMDGRYSKCVFFYFRKSTYLATFSTLIVQRFSSPKTLRFMH